LQPRIGIESPDRTLGIEAGVRNILSFFRGASRRRRSSASAFWDIDLETLGGPIPVTCTEALNLPAGKKPPRRRPPDVAALNPLVRENPPVREATVHPPARAATLNPPARAATSTRRCAGPPPPIRRRSARR